MNISDSSARIIVPGRPMPVTLSDRFRQFTQAVSHAAGNPITFAAAVAIVVLWAAAGPALGFSESWQLLINTSTTIITFLMVFVIQNAQARDSKEIHVKLDELLRAVENARNTIINCADLPDEELERVETDLCNSARTSSVGEAAPVATNARIALS
jgi:low affinity Fe/Cu permease